MNFFGSNCLRRIIAGHRWSAFAGCTAPDLASFVASVEDNQVALLSPGIGIRNDRMHAYMGTLPTSSGVSHMFAGTMPWLYCRTV
jgi:hypothetical protein